MAMGTLFITAVVAFVALLAPERCAAECPDRPPSFTPGGQPPRSQLVDFQQSGDNLNLTCGVTGIPTPSVSWFREGTIAPVVSNSNTLSIRVNESEAENEASREGTNYYCEATNIIGPGNFKAVLRSRNVSVSHSFFDGFQNMVVGDVSVGTIEGGAVALECDFNESNPVPNVTWFADNVPVMESTDDTDDQILFVEGGRYLYIRRLTAGQRMSRYHCVVNNFHDENGMPMRAPTTYTLTAGLPNAGLNEYKGLGTMTGSVRDSVKFVYAAAARNAGGDFVQLGITCFSNANVSLVVATHVITATLLEPAGSQSQVTFSCRVSDQPLDIVENIMGTIIVSRPESQPSITNFAPEQPEDGYLAREVGDEPVVYSCIASGSPAPTIIWYYNGAVIQSGSGGGDGTLTIPAPLQVNHSGIYQCFAVNSVGEDSRAWTLEVSDPAITITSVSWMTGTGEESQVVTNGRIVTPETENLEVTVNLTSFITEDDSCNFCPSVQWFVNGTIISPDDRNYCFFDSCSDTNTTSSHYFMLTIKTLNQATSGDFMAVFTNPSTTTERLQLLISVPGKSLVTLTGPSEVDVESRLVLNCSIRVILPTTVMWQKDGVSLNSTNGRIITPLVNGLSTLTIESAALNDSGTYRCESTSDAGNDSDTLLVEVRSRNVITSPSIGGIVGGVVAGVVAVAVVIIVSVVVAIKCGHKKSCDKTDGSNEKGSHYSGPPSKSTVAPSNEKAHEAIELNPSDMGATYADPSDIKHETADTGDMYAVSSKSTPKKKAQGPKQVQPDLVGDVYSVPDKTKKQKNQDQNLMYADVEVSKPRRKPPPVASHPQYNEQDVTYSEVVPHA